MTFKAETLDDVCNDAVAIASSAMFLEQYGGMIGEDHRKSVKVKLLSLIEELKTNADVLRLHLEKY